MIKTMTYTTMHFTIAFLVAWLLTGDIWVGGLVALVEPAVNSVAYFFHEKIWAAYQQRKNMSPQRKGTSQQSKGTSQQRNDTAQQGKRANTSSGRQTLRPQVTVLEV
jgi:uncharacterized membrane protein